MDFRDKVFITVAENLSFSKAAKELFISQPAVTKHIKELERSLNVTLFQRKGNKIYLTKPGKLVYDYLKRIEQIYREMEFELGRLNDAFRGRLRIGASSTISQYLLPKALASFHKRYPQIELFLFNGNSFEMEQKLLANKIDIALVENESSHHDLRYMDLLDDELVIVTGATSVYARKKYLTLSDLYEIPMVLREKGSGTLEVIESGLKKHGINPQELNIFIHLGSTEAIKNFLAGFNGIAIVSEKAIEKELRLKELVVLKINNVSFPRKFRIALRQGQMLPSVKLFIDFLKSYNF